MKRYKLGVVVDNKYSGKEDLIPYIEDLDIMVDEIIYSIKDFDDASNFLEIQIGKYVDKHQDCDQCGYYFDDEDLKTIITCDYCLVFYNKKNPWLRKIIDECVHYNKEVYLVNYKSGNKKKIVQQLLF